MKNNNFDNLRLINYPQTNGLTEVTNKTIVEGLKQMLDSTKSKWIDELPNVLWSYRTTPHPRKLESPFSLCFSIEDLFPIEIDSPSFCVDNFLIEWNNLKITENLALLDHIRSNTAIKKYNYKRSLAAYKNSRVRPHTLMMEDLVLRKNSASHQKSSRKLNANWEGPYIITKVNPNGSF